MMTARHCRPKAGAEKLAPTDASRAGSDRMGDDLGYLAAAMLVEENLAMRG